MTSRIKLGTAVSVVFEYNPLGLAKRVATLDVYPEGRVLLGIGVGSIREQADIYGTDYPPPVEAGQGDGGGHEGAVDSGGERVLRKESAMPPSPS